MCSKIKPKVIGLVQARMGSSRLPGKVMMTIEDKPLVGHIYSRLKAVKSISEITVIILRNSVLDKFSNVEETTPGTIKNKIKGFVIPPVK